MGFSCASAECSTNDRQRKKPDLHPGIQDVVWIKFPTDASSRNRWRRLIHRDGVRSGGTYIGRLEINYQTRLCSRHFNKEDIDPWGNVSADPTKFAWNYWGRPLNPRRSRAAVSATQTPTAHVPEPNAAALPPSAQPDIHPGADQEMADAPPPDQPSSQPDVIVVAEERPGAAAVGGLEQFVRCPTMPTHDYCQLSQASGFDTVEVGVQTDLTGGKVEWLLAHVEEGFTLTPPSGQPPPTPSGPPPPTPSGPPPSTPSGPPPPTPSESGWVSFSYAAEPSTSQPTTSQAPPSPPVAAMSDGPMEDWILDSDERCNLYTGIESVDLLKGVFELVEPHADNMKYWRQAKSSEEKRYETLGTKKPGPKRKLSLFAEYVITLMMLRLNLPQFFMADLFGVSGTTISVVFRTWLNYLNQTLVPATVFWPSQAQVRAQMPLEFKKYFPKTRCIIDCFEIKIEKPSNKEAQYITYSTYKSHNTLKGLVGINPNGALTFVSDLYSGNCSDKFITENSGFVDLVEKDDQVMADRGFRIEDTLLPRGCMLLAPPFTRRCDRGKGKRLNVLEIRHTRRLAGLRIHVERAIQRMRTWRILSHLMPSYLQPVASVVVKVVAALCNLKGVLFYSRDQMHIREKRPKRKKAVAKRLQKGKARVAKFPSILSI